MRIAVGSDHRGLALKSAVLNYLSLKGHSFEDLGTYDKKPVDYPDVARKVGGAVAEGGFERGILICGTGIGMCIAANKVKGVRAALSYNSFTARRARQHTNANVLCLGGEEVKGKELEEILDAFLTTDFEGGRHQARLDKVKAIEDGLP